MMNQVGECNIHFNRKIPRPTLYSSICFMFLLVLPFHTQVFYRVIPKLTGAPQQFVSGWKEFVILMLLFPLIFNKVLAFSALKLNMTHIFFVGFVVYLFCLFPFNFGLNYLYGFRMFLEPLLMYVITKNVIINRFYFIHFIYRFYCVGTVICLWAIFQASFLGDQFLIQLGYPSNNGLLHTSFYIAMFFFQRAVGTFTSPNTLGAYIQILLMLSVYLMSVKKISKNVFYFFGQTILLVSLLYSFSRSSWLAFLISFFVYNLLSLPFLVVIKGTIKAILCSIVLCAFLYVVLPDVVTPVITHIYNTTSLKDPSSVGHLSSLKDGISTLSANPLGFGLGVSGPGASERTGKYIHVENSFLIIGYDIGVLGLLLYTALLSCLGLMIVSKIKTLTSNDNTYHRIICSIWCGQMIIWNLLPITTEIEIMCIFFALLGFSANNHIWDTT